MRLKERDDAALGIAAARRVERRFDFGRMMRVIVDDERAVVVAEDLEAAIDAQELGNAGGDRVGTDAELARDCNRGQRIAHVVLAGNEELEETDAVDFERRSAIVELQIARRHISAGAEAVADDLRIVAAPSAVEQRRDRGIIDASDDRAARPHVFREDAERFDDVVEAAVVLEVIGLDIRDNGDLRPQLVEGAVVLVRLDDDDVALAVLGVRGDVLQDAADDDGRIEAGIFENGGDHGRSRGLAVCPGNADAALFIDDRREQILAADDLDALLAPGVDLGVRTFDGGSDDDRIDAGQVRGVMSDADVDSAAGQKRHDFGRFEIASGDGFAASLQDLCNPAHSDAADANEMNVLNFV